MKMLLFLITAATFVSFKPTDAFKLVRQEKGISLYERWVFYNGHTVREMKLIFAAAAPSVKNVTTLLKDGAKGKAWNNKSKEYKIAPTKDDNVWLNYIRYSLPWPMDDQDCCLKYWYSPYAITAKICTINFESIQHDRFPSQKKVTRLQGTRGKWVVENTGNNKLRISYQIITNKSAEVPRWISDPIIYDNIMTTMEKFKNMLEHS